jgi:hypothetical protein
MLAHFLKAQMFIRAFILRLIVCTMGVLTFVGTASSVETIKQYPTIEEHEQYAKIGAVVGYGWFDAPLERILLIRRGEDLCAVRFTEFHQGEFYPRRWYRMDGHSLHAEYDWFVPAPGTGQFSDDKEQTGHAKVERYPRTGLGAYAWVPGDWRVECGPFELSWTYPTGVEVYEERKRSSGLEFGPTAWRSPSEINLQHPRLKWYGYEESRKTFLIPLAELPGGEAP